MDSRLQFHQWCKIAVAPIALLTMTVLLLEKDDKPGDGWDAKSSNTSPTSSCESLYQEKSGQTAQSALIKAGLADRVSQAQFEPLDRPIIRHDNAKSSI